jgi:DNA polymerase III sliding clamp (beta) subunit (PCNA family)
VTEYVESGFSIEKLIDIFRCSKLSESVGIEIGNDIPLTLRFELPAGDGYIQFLLAPKIEWEG